jgi:hypothetical protein
VDLFRFTKETPAYLLNLEGDHIGYRDQRFFGSINRYGKVKATLNGTKRRCSTARIRGRSIRRRRRAF